MGGILVVCTGNICRSPMAEGFLRAALAEAPISLDVSSAGTAGWDGSGATDEAVRAAAERGVDISGHLARELRGDMVDGADLVIGMAVEHRDAVVRARPDAADRTFTIKELVRVLEAKRPGGSLAERVAAAAAARNGSGPAAEDVRDPLGEPLDRYREVAGELQDLADRLVAGLTERTE